ncbi:DtxR family Mn-dependent transcriptional regulator [Microbacteriaceae bacterium SG_E_30_P1]|uniref:Manganese transport regulator n=1 Tax=Antiquaquibacter oligotrophicus TaxID=2880260 RepID=A0ABT6KL30_9MICO|nr:metal-dependent transcriptional regulator [Antiquaquibacter oligotrophicus]MDH6180461.1 DtxR family Mn-dependent transcriptional regulator [Antiquaquibacter oligotrophicus]UDF13801.1 metal-dependent transcriptional regulator [Antiquaquibacter oligotrophicus]
MPVSASAIEDYVKVIYAHTEWQSEPITSSVLAARLGLAASSVTEMIKKLVVQGLVLHEPYGAIELTPSGRRLALGIVRRHRLIETWLVEQLGYRWDEVHDEAEVLEHAVSDRLLDALDARLGHPTSDPHGDPIPTSDLDVVMPDAVLLSTAESGGTIARVSDRDPMLLRYLAAEGLSIGARLTAQRRGEMPTDALDAIWVIPD